MWQAWQVAQEMYVPGFDTPAAIESERLRDAVAAGVRLAFDRR